MSGFIPRKKAQKKTVEARLSKGHGFSRAKKINSGKAASPAEEML
jgi:hypothetical protein